MRRLALAAVVLAVLPASAHAVDVGPGPAHALAAQDGRAWAVVDSGRADAPFALVEMDGRRAQRGPAFGEPDAQSADVAPATPDPMVSWSRPVSNGAIHRAQPAFGDAPARELGVGTGPGRLVVAAGEVAIATPDRRGNAVLLRADGVVGLGAGGPVERHLPLDALAQDDRVLALDVAQRADGDVMPRGEAPRPGRTILQTLGADAPTAPITTRSFVQDLEASLATARGVIAVVYRDTRGRTVLATAAWRPDAAWRLKVLPFPGRGRGMPAVAFAGDRAHVVSIQSGDPWVALTGGGLPTKIARIARTAAVERDPRAAATPEGDVFAAWTAEAPRARARARAVVVRLR